MSLISKKALWKTKEKLFRTEQECDWYPMWRKVKKVVIWIYINNVTEKHLTSENIYFLVNDEVPSTSSQIAEKIEDIQEVDVHGVYLSWITQY